MSFLGVNLGGIGTQLGGDPGLSTSGSSDFQDFLKLATLGTSTFLGYTALSSNRPSTIQVSPNGQLLLSGGGAVQPTAGTLGSIPGIIWVMLAVVILIVIVR